MKDFLTDEEVMALETRDNSPDFISDEEMLQLETMQSPSPSSNTATTVPRKNRLGQVANIADTFFGAGKIGEAIGTQIARFRASPEERPFIEGGPSGRELLGSAARSALLFTPTGRLANTIGTGARALGAGAKLANVTGRVGAGALGGYGFDVASSIENGENLGETFKPGTGSLTGGGLPIAGAAIGKPLKSKLSSFAGASTESRLLDKTKELKTLTTSLEKNTKYTSLGGKRVERSNPIKTISELGIAPLK